MDGRATRYPALLMLAVCAVGFIPYLLALQGFFSNDDWVLLWHYGRMPLSRAWEFFSPRTIWFYRPLQSLQFGVFHQLFGLNSAPYNLALLLAHACACTLLYHLVKEISGRALLAWLTTAAFALQWIYLDMLLWKANFNSLQWALVTLAACLCFTRYLRERTPKLLAWTYGLTVLNFFTKEQSVNLSLLLGLIWLFHANAQSADPEHTATGGDSRWKAKLWEAVRLIGPVAGMTLVYVAGHRLFIRDIYVEQKPGYFFVNPGQAVVQTAHIYHHALLSFLTTPLLNAPVMAAQRAITGVFGGASWTLMAVVPVAVAVNGWRTRDRLLGLGLAWIIVSFLPCVFLKDYHASRFYYLPAAGAALVLARLAEQLWHAAASLSGAGVTFTRVATASAVAGMLAANFHVTYSLIENDLGESARVRGAFGILTDQRGKVAPGALVVLRNAPASYFGNGLGAREMAKFALRDATVEAVIDGQDMEPWRVAKMEAIPNVYLLDLGAEPLRLVQVKGTRPARTAAR